MKARSREKVTPSCCAWLSMAMMAALVLSDGGRAEAGVLYRVTDLGPGVATSVNASGQAAGYTVTGFGVLARAAVYSGGATTTLDPLPGDTFGAATGINGAGQVVGYSGHQQGEISQIHAFLYGGGTTIDLNALLNATSSSASGINDAGEIVGSAVLPGPRSSSHAFLYSSCRAIFRAPPRGSTHRARSWATLTS
jgi:probable HAF family extracellular repeat protein